MATQESVRLQLRNLGASPAIMQKAEIRHLPDILMRDEVIKEFIAGTYAGGFGMLLATDRRLLFVDKKFFDLLVDDIPYSMIAAVEFDVSMIWGRVTIFTRAKNFKFKRIRKQRTLQFARYVETRMYEAQSKIQNDTPLQRLEKRKK